MLEKFELASVVKCLPKQWKEGTYTKITFFNWQLKRDIEIKNEIKVCIQNIIKKIKILPSS